MQSIGLIYGLYLVVIFPEQRAIPAGSLTLITSVHATMHTSLIENFIGIVQLVRTMAAMNNCTAVSRPNAVEKKEG